MVGFCQPDGSLHHADARPHSGKPFSAGGMGARIIDRNRRCGAVSAAFLRRCRSMISLKGPVERRPASERNGRWHHCPLMRAWEVLMKRTLMLLVLSCRLRYALSLALLAAVVASSPVAAQSPAPVET